MDAIIRELKKDFHSKLNALQAPSANKESSLAVLTQEELKELEARWIELNIWKSQQS